MKKINIFLLLLSTLFVMACSDTEEPTPMEPEVPFVWAETIEMDEFISKYNSGLIEDEDVVFEGQVVSTDEFGNLSGVIYLASGESNIALELTESNYFDRYPIGAELLILASGLTYVEDETGNRLFLEGGLMADNEETYIKLEDQRLAPTGRSITDISALTDDWLGAYVRIFALQFDEEFTGGALTNGLFLRKSNGESIKIVIESGAQIGDEVPYGSGSIRGILGKDADGVWTVRPMEPTDLVLTGIRHSIFNMAEYVQDGFTLPYQIMYPKNYDSSKSYPLIIFLHGAGERGTNNTSQMANGPNTFANVDARDQYPAIVVFPQCPGNFMWSRRTKETINGTAVFTFPVEQEPDVPLKAVIQMTRDFIADGVADASQIYVMGLSMGGIGTLEYCYYAPDLPAAAISLAGGHDQDIAFTYGEKVSIRMYAGANDGVVPSIYSKEVFDALKFLPNADVEFYEDPNRGHEWNYVLNDETQVLPWLFSKTK